MKDVLENPPAERDEEEEEEDDEELMDEDDEEEEDSDEDGDMELGSDDEEGVSAPRCSFKILLVSARFPNL